MLLTSRKPLLSLVLFAALACDGGPSSLSTGNLSISVSGLPAGSAAAVMVTGPDGYSQSVSGTLILSQLVAGAYTVAASSVTVGSTVYSATPASQSVLVGSSTANAPIVYASGGGMLALTINGLGTSSTAAMTVTGPGSYTQSVGSTRTLVGLAPGSYTVTARDTTATGGTPHTAAPTTQSVTVTASATATATVTYSPPSGGPLNLRIAGLYITQSTQTYGGTVPLVKNRNGYLRVFVVANSTNTAAPSVRVRFYGGGLLPVDSTLILPPGLSVPTAVDESSLSYTWNVPVSGTLIQPGLSIQAEVDPGNAVFESDETDNLFPAVGQLATDIRTVPAVRVTFVPILQSASGLQGNVTNGNKDAFLDMTKRMHPIDSVDAVVGLPFPTSWTLQANGDGWAELLLDFDAAMAADGRHYYGVAKVSYTSGVAGVAYVSSGSANAHASLGWDYLPSGAAVVAHELGHNWGRNHAPCGGPSGVDNAYPYPDGRIGVFGLDVAAQSLKPATTSDIMGYCDPKWIGDYSYKGVLNYRSANPLVMSAAAAQPVQPSLLVWGHIRDGVLVLEPSFQVNTRPRLPVHRGPYSIEARADDGTTLFALSFAPSEVADVPGSRQNFAFAVPLPAAKAARLSSLRLAGRGREAVSMARVPSAAQVQGGVQSDSVEVRRVGAGRVGLRWNAGVHPMVMVRDAATGQVLSFARGGNVELPISTRQIDLVLSNGLKSRSRRVRVGP